MEPSPVNLVAAIAADQWGLFTTQQARAVGFSQSQLNWQSRPGGPFERVLRSVYRLRDFSAPVLQPLGAALLARGPDAVACGHSAGWALGLDGVEVGRIEMVVVGSGSHRRDGVHRGVLEPHQVVSMGPFRVTDPVTTLLDLAADLDDRRWEWSLEAALRKPWLALDDVLAETTRRSQQHRSGAARAKRVLALRPVKAKPTGSQLETEFLQLIRPVREIPEPERQYPVSRHGRIEARLDFAWPALHAYTEVLGSQHRESLHYDANRETLIAATLGWLASEVTAREIRRASRPTINRMIEFLGRASGRVSVGSLGT